MAISNRVDCPHFQKNRGQYYQIYWTLQTSKFGYYIHVYSKMSEYMYNVCQE